MHVLGLTGKKKAGKDTVTQFIMKSMPHKNIVRVGFADALKLEVARACCVTVDEINKHKDNFRLILQGWGTDFRRKLYGEDYWITRWERHVLGLPDDVYMVIVPDIRFHNEAKTIQDIGGKICLVDRPTTDTDTHESETTLIPYDYRIVNDKDLGSLLRETKTMMQCIFQKTA